MRIALVSQEFPPDTGSGGIGTQALQKAQWMAGRGHDVHVISHSIDGQRHEYRQDNFHVVRIPGFDDVLPIATEEVRWLTYSMYVAAELAKLHEAVGLDLVEFPEWGCEAYVHLLNRSESTYIPTVIHLHGPIVMFADAIGWPDPNTEFFRVARMMEETCLRLADGTFSSSRCSAKWCARYYKFDVQSIPVMHTGIDTKQFRPLPVEKEEKKTIIFVGRLERNKGVDVLVEAGCRLAKKYPDLQLRLLGRGNENLIRELRHITLSAGHPDLLDLTGYVERNQLPEYLSRAHVFAAPSDYEGGPGFVYLEAMACGLPVIAGDGSGASEMIEDGVTGFLVPPRNADALYDKLDRLLSDESLRRETGRRAREYVQREVNRDDCLRRIENYYCEVAQRCHRLPAYV